MGWNNPLPIRQEEEIAIEEPESCWKWWWRNISPVARAVRGHSSETPGPSTPHSYSTSELSHSRDHHTFYTSHPLLSSTLPFLFPTHHAERILKRPHCQLRDTPAVTTSHGKGSGNLPNASVSGINRTTTERRRWSCVFLWRWFTSFLIFVSLLI